MKKLSIISIIWLIFAILFLCFGGFHLNVATKSISPFHITQVGNVQAIAVGINIKEFVQNFNSYIEHYNKTSRRQNILSAIGYLAASVMAFLSMYLSLRRQS